MYSAAATYTWIEWNLDRSCCSGDVDFNCYGLFFTQPKESLSLLILAVIFLSWHHAFHAHNQDYKKSHTVKSLRLSLLCSLLTPNSKSSASYFLASICANAVCTVSSNVFSSDSFDTRVYPLIIYNDIL